jgi:hypothetical protein
LFFLFLSHPRFYLKFLSFLRICDETMDFGLSWNSRWIQNFWFSCQSW